MKRQLTVSILFIFALTGCSSSPSVSSNKTITPSAPKEDRFTRLACEQWHSNIANASVETYEQQVKGAQNVMYSASLSEDPNIYSLSRILVEATINQDAQAYLKYGTEFGNACLAAGH